MGPGLRRDGEEAGVEIATHHIRRRQLDYSLLRRDEEQRHVRGRQVRGH